MNQTATPATPTLTVVMPVFNALPYLDNAIASILGQSNPNFRFVIYDDHSTDGSYDCLLNWAKRDSRIEVFRGNQRLGPSGSSNAAASLAKTEFVARMDADDVAMPDRLERELNALCDHSGAVLVGSIFDMIDGTGDTIRRASLNRGSGSAPFAHPSIMYRRADFDAVGGYRVGTDYFEDFDLYRRLAQRGDLLVIEKPLIKMRFAGQHARLRDDREIVIDRLKQLYKRDNSSSARISPIPIYSLAVLSILALQRPHLLGMLLKRGQFSKPFHFLPILAIITVAEVSPRLARSLTNAASAVRGSIRQRRSDVVPIHIWDVARYRHDK